MQRIRKVLKCMYVRTFYLFNTSVKELYVSTDLFFNINHAYIHKLITNQGFEFYFIPCEIQLRCRCHICKSEVFYFSLLSARKVFESQNVMQRRWETSPEDLLCLFISRNSTFSFLLFLLNSARLKSEKKIYVCSNVEFDKMHNYNHI